MGRWRALAARCAGMAARGKVLSTPWRNTLFVLFLGGILAYGAGLASLFQYGEEMDPIGWTGIARVQV